MTEELNICGAEDDDAPEARCAGVPLGRDGRCIAHTDDGKARDAAFQRLREGGDLDFTEDVPIDGDSRLESSMLVHVSMAVAGCTMRTWAAVASSRWPASPWAFGDRASFEGASFGRLLGEVIVKRSRRREQQLGRFYERLTLWRAVRLIVVVTLTIVVLAALLERVIEPETFPTFGEALWWSVVTISTVGYGDVAPQSGAGRLVAGLVMVVSLAFVPVVTSIVVSALLTRHQQRRTESTANRREDAPPSD